MSIVDQGSLLHSSLRNDEFTSLLDLPSTVPNYEPSGEVTLMWTAFGVQCMATLYIMSRAIVLPNSARKFHHIFVAVGIVASFSYLMEAGALEYIDLLHDDDLSANEHASTWRLPCRNSPFVDLDNQSMGNETPMCTVVPYYFSRIVVQSLMVYGIAFLAGTPKREHVPAIFCVALMEGCNFMATLFKSFYQSITIMTLWSFGLRLFLMIPVIYFLLHGIEHNIRRAPVRVRGVCHGWCLIMVVLQVVNVVLWCVAYGTGLLSLPALLGCRILSDMTITVVIPLLVLRDFQLLMLVRDRDERVGALNQIAQHTAIMQHDYIPSHLDAREKKKPGMDYRERVMQPLNNDLYTSPECSDQYEVLSNEDLDISGNSPVRTPPIKPYTDGHQRTLSKTSETTAISLDEPSTKAHVTRLNTQSSWIL